MGESAAGGQIISVPKGGGAMRGIGEKFSPDLHTGTGNFTIPIALPPGRNGFQPQLNLVYSTGNGNGPFGFGWQLDVPGVSRKTATGIPRYDDTEDVFLLSGAEDLVPVEVLGNAARYRPRTEASFARILHYRSASSSYWRVQSKDGRTSTYGTPDSLGTDPAVVAKPSDRTRVFAWKLTRTEDPFGNRIEYDYERDLAQEGARHWDQIYLKRIRYGDYVDAAGETRFLVSVSFEYETRPADAFSEYRPGFEIRTRKRCKRIVIRTHAHSDLLVRTYDLIYADERPELEASLPLNGASLLSTIVATGHDGAERQSLPAVELRYSAFDPHQRNFFPLTGEQIPARSLAGGDLEFVDLFGQGLPDVLELNGYARYWRNLGGSFDLPRSMRAAPGGLALQSSGVQLIDADGDGRTDLLITTESLSGYFPLRFGGLWDSGSFRRYRYAPSFSLDDPEVKLVDLDGDGVTDAIRSGARMEYFFNHPEQGWHRTSQAVRRALEEFPDVNFSDPRVKWADMSGDGLQDIVLIHDGTVEYWPNLGHGNWSKRLRMGSSPRFPHEYDPARILVGDIDGDGLADIVYVEDQQVTVWINIGGNGWSKPVRITGTPPVSDASSVRLADMLGNGVPGLLWSCDAGTYGRHHLFFLDFIGGKKPYLLTEIDNHIGAVTRIEYAPSTRYFLTDQQNPATRWRTTLPFPVHVVSQMEVIDELSGGKLTSQYRYHHGYWDGAEREFRGFGRVEQIDSESFDQYDSPGLHGAQPFFARVERKYFSAPTLTRTWFHQGPVGDEFGQWEEMDWSDEYWREDGSLLGHTRTVNQFLRALPSSPDVRRAKRDALRALRGSVLRSELYALDGSLREDRPYTVTEYAYGLREESVSEADPGRPRIFFPHQVGQRTTQWERGNDPMTQLAFTFTADFDEFGQPLSRLQIACPRGWRSMEDRPAQAYLATRTISSYCTPTDAGIYIHDRLAQSVSHELVQTAGKTIAEIWRQSAAGTGLSLMGHVVHYYDGAAFMGLPFGQVGAYGAAVRTETLAMTDEQLLAAYGGSRPPYPSAAASVTWPARYPEEFRSMLAPNAGYVFRSGAPYTQGYYIVSERRCYDFQDGSGNQGLITTVRDSLGSSTSISYDGLCRVLPTAVVDAAGLRISADIDYRVLQAFRVTDANGSSTEVAFTPLGLVKATFLRGNDGAGDQLRPSVVMEYVLDSFERSPPQQRQPIFVRTTRHIYHDTNTEVPLPTRDEVIESYEYSDGFGRLLQTRAQAEDVMYGGEIFGQGSLPADQSLAPGDFAGRRRQAGDPVNVVVNGWRTYDNKGQVVEAFEPFFSSGWEYRSPRVELEELGRNVFGAKVATFYDPRGQLVRTVNPDGSEQHIVLGVPGSIAAPDLSDPSIYEPTPWESYTYDANDNAGRTHAGEASSYAHHWNTPSSIRVDALGRTVEAIARNRASAADPMEDYRTRSSYDIRGNVLSITDALGRRAFSHLFDFANRRLHLESIDAGVRTTVFDAAGQAVEQRDSKGAWSLHGYDALNRPCRVWARDDAGAPLGLRIRTEYGDGGTSTQLPAERAAQRAENRLGRPHRQYDEAGLLIFERYGFRGNVIEKERRVISDETLLAAFDAPPPDWRVPAFRADWQPPVGTTLQAHASAQLESGGYRTSARYDALGRMVLLKYPQDVEGERKTLVPEYNRAGALERVLLDGQVYVDHIAYDAKGQRSLIAYGNGVLTAHAYDPQTLRLKRLWMGRCTKLVGPATTYRAMAPSQPLQDLSYEYDLAGNILKIADRTPGCGVINTPKGRDALDRLFEYDAVYRLLAATGRESSNIASPRPWTDEHREGYNSWNHGTPNQDNAPTLTQKYAEEYSYDPAGNLLSMRHGQNGNAWVRHFGMGGRTPQQWQQQWAAYFNTGVDWLNPPGNQLTHAGDDQTTFAQTHVFDENGNLIREATSRHFEWDHGDRLKAFRVQAGNGEPSVHAIYLYDAAGQRLKKLVRLQGGESTATLYIDGVFEHHRLTSSATLRENNSLHVMDDASRVAMVRIGAAFPDDASPAVGYHLGDHLGSSSLVIDAAGSWINREEYTPYGETTLGSFACKRYRHSGMERDERSGLYYHGARYYAPWLVRWTSCDPAGSAAGSNLFSYVRGNPLRFTDPSGCWEESAPGGPGIERAGPGEKGAEQSAPPPSVPADGGAQATPAPAAATPPTAAPPSAPRKVECRPLPVAAAVAKPREFRSGGGPEPGSMRIQASDGSSITLDPETADVFRGLAQGLESISPGHDYGITVTEYGAAEEPELTQDELTARIAAATMMRDAGIEVPPELEAYVSPAPEQKATVVTLAGVALVAPIFGKAQKTPTPGHDTKSQEIADSFAADVAGVEGPVAGPVAAVHLNRSWSRLTDRLFRSGRRPDVTIVFDDGEYFPIEVMSPSDTLMGRSTPGSLHRALINRTLKNAPNGYGAITNVRATELNRLMQRFGVQGRVRWRR